MQKQKKLSLKRIILSPETSKNQHHKSPTTPIRPNYPITPINPKTLPCVALNPEPTNPYKPYRSYHVLPLPLFTSASSAVSRSSLSAPRRDTA